MKPEQSPRLRSGTAEIHMRGCEAEIAEWMDTVFYAVEKLRRGELEAAEPESRRRDVSTILKDLESLTSHITGVRDAVIRIQADSGGTVDDLVFATGVPRSTAGYRRKQVVDGEPTSYELWATGELARRQRALLDQARE